jgi:hypothetical protein
MHRLREDTLQWVPHGAMRKESASINQEEFARFLHWLDENPEHAAERYERIRRKLITICAARGGSHPEEMADECIDLVVQKVPEIAPTYTGDPEFYFYGVVKFVVMRWNRKSQPGELFDRADQRENPYEIERSHACLDQCLAKLDDASRDLVLEYYRHDKQAKIDHRANLARGLGITANALRIRGLRIRQTLEDCVRQCTEGDIALV